MKCIVTYKHYHWDCTKNTDKIVTKEFKHVYDNPPLLPDQGKEFIVEYKNESFIGKVTELIIVHTIDITEKQEVFITIEGKDQYK